MAHVEDETSSTAALAEDETTSSVAPPPGSAAGAFRAACAAIDRVELFRDALAAAAASRRGLDVARVLSSVAASASGRGLGARARFLAERASARVETGGGDCGATIDVSSSLAAVDVSSSRSSDANFAARSGDVRAAAAKALRLDLVREGTPEAVARGTRRGWVFWYVGSPVVVGTRRFVFDPRRFASDGERFAELADDEQRST